MNKHLYGILFSIMLPLALRGSEPIQIPLHLSAPAQQQVGIVYVGIPFPKGTITSPGAIMITDEEGRAVPSSAHVTARWPEHDSIRWLGVCFLADPAKRYQAVRAKGEVSKGRGVEVTPVEGGYMVDTGVARYRISEKGALISEAWVDHNGDGKLTPDERVLVNSAGDDLYAVDHRGREGWAGRDLSPGQLRFESAADDRDENAPLLRAEFRREGWYLTERDERIARHVTRLTFHAGEAKAHLEHRLVLTESSHRHWLTDYGIRFRHAHPLAEVTFPKESDDTLSLQLTEKTPAAALFQEKAYYLSQMDRQRDCHFEIVSEASEGHTERLYHGALAGNWALAHGTSRGLGVAVRNFWQTYPKEFHATREMLTARLWSPRGGRAMDFRYATLKALWPPGWYDSAPEALKTRLPRIDTDAAGMARTHEIILSPGDLATIKSAAAQLEQPSLCLVAPEWLRKTEAMGRFHPHDPDRFPREEGLMEAWFDQSMEVVRDWGDYGFLEFGNWPHVWYRQTKRENGETRWTPSIDRYAGCLDYGFHAHLWRMYARSGQRKYFEAAEETAAQRLDITMAHWDQLAADAPVPTKLPRRLRGTYTFSNSPFPWSGGVSFHHNSGTDIRTLAYWHHLGGRRSAGEMLVAYGDAVKRVWSSGNLDPFRGTRPFASLKNLATVYQETGDPELLRITRDQLQWLVDLEAPQGISEEKETTKLGKYGVKVGAIHRVYEVTGDSLARASLLRGATTRATTSLGDSPFTYFNTSGEQLGEAARITGDPLFLRALRRDMELAIRNYEETETRGWKLLSPAPTFSLANNVYPLGGIAYGLDVLKEADLHEPLTPYARMGGAGPEVFILLEKHENASVRLDLRSRHALAPRVYGANDLLVKEVRMKPTSDQLFTRDSAPTRWEIELPAHLPAGVYRIEGGAGKLPWEVTWSNAEKLTLYAPGGVIIGSGSRHWGNRIMTAREDHPEAIYFQGPEDGASLSLATTAPIELTTPDGSVRTIPSTQGQWQKLEVATGSGVWRIFSADPAWIAIRGVPPVFAYAEKNRLFAPGAEALALPKPAPITQPRSGVELKGGQRLHLPLALPTKEGTLECWVRPTWSSREQFGRLQGTRTLMDAGAWKLLLHRFGEMSATATVEGKNSPVETNAALVMEEDRWTHIALQWRTDGDAWRIELWVDGTPQRFGTDHAGMPTIAEKFHPTSVQKIFFGAAINGSLPLDSEIAGLRLSSTPRYRAAFTPDFNITTQADPTTLALYPLIDDLTPSVGEVRATLLSR